MCNVHFVMLSIFNSCASSLQMIGFATTCDQHVITYVHISQNVFNLGELELLKIFRNVNVFNGVIAHPSATDSVCETLSL